MSNDIIIPGDEAYLSFGGWAKPMKNPPVMHERRRYIVDVECTDAELKSSSKGQRGTRKLSILRVQEVTGVNVPPRPKNDEDDDTPPMFNDDGTVSDDAERDASADEGDEIMAERREAEQAAEDAARMAAEQSADLAADATGDVGTEQESGDPWPGGEAADADAADDPDAEHGDTFGATPDNVAPMFREAGNE